MYHAAPRTVLTWAVLTILASAFAVALVSMSPEHPAPCFLAWQGGELVCADRPPKPCADPFVGAPIDVRLDLGLPIDLNAATMAQLRAVRGIGPRRAAEIVALRAARAGFCALDELVDIKGIGTKTVGAIARHAYVQPSARRMCTRQARARA